MEGVGLQIIARSERLLLPMFRYAQSPSSKVTLLTGLSFFILLILLATPAFAQQAQLLLGDTNVESSPDNNPDGTAEAFPVQAVASGKVGSLSVYVDRSSSAAILRVGMYTSSNGHPGVLLASGVISSPRAGQWNTVGLPATQVTKGTTYWLALMGTGGVVRFRDRNAACRSEVGRQANLSSLPAMWTTGSTYATCIVSMFETGTITTGGGITSTGVSISPRSVSLQAGKQQQFAAAVNGVSSSAVTWSTSGGTITSAGLYTAPASAGTYSVIAKVVTSGRRSRSTTVASSSVVVTVAPSSPAQTIGVSVSPASVSLQTSTQQQFQALVSGSTNSAVTWSASSGTITTSGLYTAPAATGTYTVMAVSAADKTKSASAKIVVSAPQSATVTISPTKASVAEGNQLQYVATVSGVSNTAVTWAVSQGNGTITQSGLYTAPLMGESDVITATSQADSTKSASATISVLLPHSVVLSWSPSTSSIVYYKVYRGSVKGGPYSLLTSNIKANTYKDSTVQSGLTYYYVTSGVNSGGAESTFSNEFQSLIPSP